MNDERVGPRAVGHPPGHQSADGAAYAGDRQQEACLLWTDAAFKLAVVGYVNERSEEP